MPGRRRPGAGCFAVHAASLLAGACRPGTHGLETALLAWLRGYFDWVDLVDSRSLRGDLQAGFTNAVIVLPQGIAYALIAGLPPQFGLYAAIVPAIVAALLGSSRHLISGPTAALSIVVYSVVSQHALPGTDAYIQAALVLTLLVGLFQLALTLGNLGVLVNFVSHTVVIGFTAGAGTYIFFVQLRHVLGVDIPSDLSFPETLLALVGSLGSAQPRAMLVAAATLATCLLLQRFYPRSPHMAAGLVAGAVVAALLGGEGEAIRMVGEVPRSLPPLSFPVVDIDTGVSMLPGAVAVGLLGLVEAVSIGRAIAVRSGQMIHGNREFFGQGVSNVVGSFFSCYASSGSFTRSGVNYDSGAKTPIAGVSAGVALAVIVLAFAPIAAHLPLAAMGAVVLLVAWRLILWDQIRVIFRVGGGEIAVLAATFLSVLVFPLEMAVYIGVAVSLAVYLRRTSRPRMIRVDAKAAPAEGVAVVRLDGSLFFGAVVSVANQLREIREPILVLAGRGVNFIDVAGAEMLAAEARRRAAKGGRLLLCNLKPSAWETLEKGGFAEVFKDSVFDKRKDALAAIGKEEGAGEGARRP